MIAYLYALGINLQNQLKNKNLIPNENYKSLNFFLDFDKQKFQKYFCDSP